VGGQTVIDASRNATFVDLSAQQANFNTTSAPNFTSGVTGLRISRSGGPNAGDYGNGITFGQHYWTGDTSNIIRTAGIFGKKTIGNGSFGGGLEIWTQPNGGANMSVALSIDHTQAATFAGAISSGAITTTALTSSGYVKTPTVGMGAAAYVSSVNHTATYREGLFWHADTNYSIARTVGAWTGDYQQLKLDWPTGIELDGGTAYGKSGVNVVAGNFKVGGTTVIDASRNVTFNNAEFNSAAGSFIVKHSSYGNASTPWVQFKDGGDANLGYVGYGSSGNADLYIVNQGASNTGDIILYAGSQPRLTVHNDGTLDSDGPIQISGTTVIDASRNLTNIASATVTTLKETDGGDGFTEMGPQGASYGYHSWGHEFTMSGSGYGGLRFAGKKKYFTLEADVLGTNSANHQGMFWGNADGTATYGGSSTGYKTTHQNSTLFHIRTIANVTALSVNPGFDPNDGAWHHQKITASPDGYVRIWIDGVLKFEATGYIPSAAGYLGFINYTGTVRYANVRCSTLTAEDGITAATADFSGKVEFQGTAAIEGGTSNSGYGLFKGYSANNNHFLLSRGSVTGSTSSPSFSGNHQMTFVEYVANAADGFRFKSSNTGTFAEIAYINRVGINTIGGYHVNGTSVIDASRNLSSINLVKFRENGASFYISPTNANTLNAQHGSTSDDADMWINYRGYNDTFSNFRDFRIGNGKGSPLLFVDGSAATFTFSGSISSGNITAPKLYINNGTTYGVGIVNASSARFDTVDSGYSTDPLELCYHNGNGVRIGPNGGDLYLSAGSIQITGTTVIDASRVMSPTTVNISASSATTKSLTVLSSHATNAATIVVGNTVVDQTLVDANTRPMVVIDGKYPVLNINHTVTSNSNHGPTIQFTYEGYNSNRQILIGTDGEGQRLDFGFSGGTAGSNSDKNPHNGISGYSGLTPMRLFQNGLLLGSTGVYPNEVTSAASALDVRGTTSISGSHSSAIGTPNINSYGALSAGTAYNYHMVFKQANGTVRGQITNNVYGTQYGGASDYRLKENIQPLSSATSRTLALNPCTFNWIDDDDNTAIQGFVAHEVAAIVPEAVVGEKDALDADGNPHYQTIDPSKLIPILVKTIQELEARITALESL
jgi:hypothetical protein